MTLARTSVLRAALALALLLGVGGCSIGETNGSGLTFATPLAESPKPTVTVLSETIVEDP